MTLSAKHLAIANRLRRKIQEETRTVSDGEGVAMMLLWTFLMDHAQAMNIEIEKLSRDQLEAFIVYARQNITQERQH